MPMQPRFDPRNAPPAMRGTRVWHDASLAQRAPDAAPHHPQQQQQRPKPKPVTPNRPDDPPTLGRCRGRMIEAHMHNGQVIVGRLVDTAPRYSILVRPDDGPELILFKHAITYIAVIDPPPQEEEPKV